MNTFTSLISTYTTWDALKTYLAEVKVAVYEVPDTTLAMIRYVKGQTDMAVPHVGAFRSVVWDTARHVPVSVTAFKSERGEGFPGFGPDSHMTMEEFCDGVMIGQFWDETSGTWRIHTRSTLDAQCRYYSKQSFATLFQEAVVATYGVAAPLTDRLEKGVSYTWILQHPENRVVCPVQKPRLVLVAAYRIAADAGLEVAPVPKDVVTPRRYFTKVAESTVGRMDMTPVLDVIGMVNREEHDQQDAGLHGGSPGYVPVDIPGVLSMIDGMRGSVRYQGVVIKDASQPLKRWKMRSQVYNEVRKMRGNTARRDFLWMDLWGKGGLEEYLKYFPEERRLTNDLINSWKTVTQSVYKIYVDAFKTRTLDRSQIPAKFRPLVYGLHNLYMTNLKPVHKSLDWHACVQWMNGRDTAQKVFVLNWDLRQEMQDRRSTALPLEPPATAALRAEVLAAVEAAVDAVAETKKEGEI